MPLYERSLFGVPVFARLDTSDDGTLDDVIYRPDHVPPATLVPRTILDLGANVGYTAVHLVNLFPDAMIGAVEMHPDNYDLLVRNTKKFPSISTMNAAVWKTNGEVGYNGSQNFTFVDEKSFIKVKCKTLIQIMFDFRFRQVDFVKMDIEGAEIHVCEQVETWKSSVACLAIETHNECYKKVVNSLRNAGFDVVPHNRHPKAIYAWNWKYDWAKKVVYDFV